MNRLLSFGLLAAVALPSIGLAKESVKIIGNDSIESVVVVKGERIPLKGSLSFLLAGSEEGLEKGKVTIHDLNLALLGAPQARLSGKKPVGKETGILGLAVTKTGGERQSLTYDVHKGVFTGKVRARVDFPQLGELKPPKHDPDGDAFETPTQDAVVQLVLKLEKPLAFQGEEQIRRAVGELTLNIQVREITELGVLPYHIQLKKIALPIDYTKFLKLEAVRELCLQPVRIRSSLFDPSPTGAGLSFGMPGANTQWRKGDVVFKVRDFKTVTSSSLKIISSGETSSLRSKVEDDDCIEVFFAKEFDPNDMFGGGATFGSGTASAQIISSDENAVFGIDLTHLAHELGHVMKLAHPGTTGSSGTLIGGSTGTLMCPSGFKKDNPKVNSEENEDNVANPLFKFSLRIRTAGPDCSDSPDCGSCP